MILLTHPVHGSKFALSDTEATHDEKCGWSRYNPDTPEPPSEAAPAAPADKVKRKYTRRVQEAPVEQPNEVPSFLAPVSDESEGE